MDAAIVKTKAKNELDQLVAMLTLRLGHKIAQQDVLDACIFLGLKNIDDLETFFSENRPLSMELAEEIISSVEDIDFKTSGSIDGDLYGDH